MFLEQLIICLPESFATYNMSLRCWYCCGIWWVCVVSSENGLCLGMLVGKDVVVTQFQETCSIWEKLVCWTDIKAIGNVDTSNICNDYHEKGYWKADCTVQRLKTAVKPAAFAAPVTLHTCELDVWNTYARRVYVSCDNWCESPINNSEGHRCLCFFYSWLSCLCQGQLILVTVSSGVGWGLLVHLHNRILNCELIKVAVGICPALLAGDCGLFGDTWHG